MSKPLVFVLQLGALGMVVTGAAGDPPDLFMTTFGVGIAVIAGIGIRKRLKRS